MTATFLPSNGTEGEWFMSRWCHHCDGFCAFDDDDPCPILGNAMAGIAVEQWRCDGPAGPHNGAAMAPPVHDALPTAKAAIPAPSILLLS